MDYDTETRHTEPQFHNGGEAREVTDDKFPTQPSYSTNEREEAEITLQKTPLLNQRAAFHRGVEQL